MGWQDKGARGGGGKGTDKKDRLEDWRGAARGDGTVGWRAVGEGAANLGGQRGTVWCDTGFHGDDTLRVPSVFAHVAGMQPFNGHVHDACTHTCHYFYGMGTLFLNFLKLATRQMVAIR